jgi:hypothetical protein
MKTDKYKKIVFIEINLKKDGKEILIQKVGKHLLRRFINSLTLFYIQKMLIKRV